MGKMPKRAILVIEWGYARSLLVCMISISLVGCTRIKEHTLREGARAKAETVSLSGKADELAIWIHPKDPKQSLIIGNDKSVMGGLFAYDLQGHLITRSEYINEATGVSVRYGIQLSTGTVDIVGCAVRGTNEIKVFSIDPTTRKLIDITSPEGIPTGFLKDTYGFCFYKRASDGQLFAFVSKKGTDYIHQIILYDDGMGKIRGSLVRKLGLKEQKSFVEGMVADDEYGYFYCSDETHAILKYHADPNVPKDPFIRAFGVGDGIRGDREGLAIYKKGKGKGYLIVSSQGNSTFKIYQREGNNKFIKTAALHGVSKTDGIATTSQPIPPYYPTGIFAAHNDGDNNYLFFDWYEFSRIK